MSSAPLPRPVAGDAAAYYFRYIEQVPEGDVLSVLAGGLDETRRVLSSLPESLETFRYAPGKWSVREVVGHVLDAERLFGFRALHIARGGAGEMPSMEPDDWATNAGAGERPLGELLDELEHVRRGHLAMFRALDPAAWERTGMASGVEFRVRAFPFILAGHEIHHRRALVALYLTKPG